ncbi:unknown protein [Seminavis robusta]|uniref:Uncharacterized protein n=1 Tax=Seminavis robusta TaxID=568900 RepID=A0A9N8HDL5_9STRA|nr:unknown protein [Seminavis robusta]|eukprot:Sro349_g123370.1 n/a (455) ;mRNA; r:10781-12145
MDAAQITAIVQAAVAAALQNQNVLDATRPQPQPAAAVPFAVTPAGAGNNAWDFTSPTGLRIFMASITPFPVKYDGKEHLLRDFLRQIYQRAESYGWIGILLITDDNGTVRNITNQHGCLSKDNVTNHAITYLRQQGRLHQASVCLRKLIMASVTSKLADRLATRKVDYTVNAAAAAQGAAAAPPPIMKEDGTCMLYQLIKMVSVETITTVTIITKKLNNLEHIMEAAKSNIEVFNTMVDDLISQLQARSAQVPPMIGNLFDGYANCSDVAFAKYMESKRDSYEDGTLILPRHDNLMMIALEKYKIMQDRKVWLKKSEEQMEIMTLKAEVTKLRGRTNAKPPPAKAAGEGKKTVQGKDDDKYAWKLVAPKEGEPQQKTVNGKKYIYCPYHQTTKWVLEVNNKGVVHRTGCEKMKEALTSNKAIEADDQDAEAAALANAIEDAGSNTLLPIPVEEL